MEVSPLSREVMLSRLNLYPLNYRGAFAFSILRYPHLHRLALRLAFLGSVTQEEIRAYHVPRECQSGLGFASPPVAHHLRRVK